MLALLADCDVHSNQKNIATVARIYTKYNNILMLVNEYILYIVYSVCFGINGDANDLTF